MTASLYLHGSCAAGTDKRGSDVDLFIVTPTGQIDPVTLERLYAAGGVPQLTAGRLIDVLVGDPAQLQINHLIAHALRHGRLLAGPAVDIPTPDPAVWADQAEWHAGEQAKEGGCYRHAKAVLWAANARLVRAGAPLPKGKEAAAPTWARMVGGRWADLLDRAQAGAWVGADECVDFLINGRVKPRRRRGRRGRGAPSQPSGTAT